MKNKKALGSMISVPLGLIGFFILILILVSLLPLQLDDEAQIGNITANLYWINSSVSQQFIEGTNSTGVGGVIINVVYKFVDFIGYSAFEVARAGVVWGAENPDLINAKILIYLVFFALIAPIALVLIKLVILIVIFGNDLRNSRKEKKELKILRMQNEKQNN